ncbi:MAG: IgGFc-binding protein, partial [Segetibacter sp.]
MKLCLLIILSSLLLFFSDDAECQDFSNKGKDFWVIYMGHVDGTVSRMALYITSDQNATGKVDVNGSSIPFTVTANNVTTIQFTNSSNPSNAVVYNGQIEGVGAKRGIHVTSDKPVVVYSHILNSARSGSTLVLPTNVLGKEYYASSYNPISATNADRSEFAVVATVDNTSVEITPTAADANGTHSANVAYQVNLNKGDVYQYQSNGDLTGSHIKSIGSTTASCQPIAVFSGSTRTSLGCSNPTSGDNLYQQLFPFASWGRLFYTAPFINRAYDVFRIIVQDASTVVTVNGVALNSSSLVNGRFYEFNTQGNNTARIISSDKPICVFQYLISQNCDNVPGGSDPEMIILNAVDQTLNDIT